MKNLQTLMGNCGEKPINKKPPNQVGTEEENRKMRSTS